MLFKKFRNQNSGILSQKDLDAFFNSNEKFVIKRNSSSFNRSQSNISTKISTEIKDDKSQNQNSIQLFEEANQKLKLSLNLEKNKNQVLTSEISSLTNELTIQTTMARQLQNEKERLVEQIHYIRKAHEKIQNQRNDLLIEVGRLRHQINSMKATIEVDQEKISTLEHTNRKLIDQLNFDKEMLADFKQENAMFKANLKNISNSLINIKQFFALQREKQIINIKQMMNKRINQLRECIIKYKDQIQSIKLQQNDLLNYKNQIFSFVRRLIINNQSIKTQLNIIKSFNNDSKRENSMFLVRENDYKRIIEEQEEKIKAIILELANTKKVNMQLTVEIKANSHVQLLAPRFHTNSSYVNKLIKENQREIKEIREIIEMKDDEIARMKELLEIQLRTSKTKSEEIQRLKIKAAAQQNNKFNELTDQIQEMKAQKLRLTRKIDQLNQAQQTLKAEITDKDKIILNHVQKTKTKV